VVNEIHKKAELKKIITPHVAGDAVASEIGRFEESLGELAPLSGYGVVIDFVKELRPVSEAALCDVLERIQQRAVEIFTPRAMGPSFEEAKTTVDTKAVEFSTALKTRNYARSEKVCQAVKGAIIKAVNDAIQASAFKSYADVQDALTQAQGAYINLTNDKGPAATRYNHSFLQECKAISDRQQLSFKIDAATKEKADVERKREEERLQYNLRMEQSQAQLQAERERGVRDAASMRSKQEELGRLLKSQEAAAAQKQREMEKNIAQITNDRVAALAMQRELTASIHEQERQRKAVEEESLKLRQAQAQLHTKFQQQQQEIGSLQNRAPSVVYVDRHHYH